MSNSWFKVNSDLLHDRAVQTLSPSEFRRQFWAAVDGKPSAFRRFIRRGSDRPSAEVWAKIRQRIFARDDYTCQYCEARGVKLECDHVVPVSRGGSNHDSNLITACKKCNRSKRAKTPEEWLS